MGYAHLFYEFKPENFYNENIVSNVILCIIAMYFIYILENVGYFQTKFENVEDLIAKCRIF